MPLYEYQCQRCGKNFEIQHKMADSAPTKGPGCSESAACPLERQISRVAGVVKSPNPMAAAAQKFAPFSSPSNTKDTKSEQNTHQCGSGCALHSR